MHPDPFFGAERGKGLLGYFWREAPKRKEETRNEKPKKIKKAEFETKIIIKQQKPERDSKAKNEKRKEPKK